MLIADVGDGFGQARDTHTEGAVALVPFKVAEREEIVTDPLRGASFQRFDGLGNRAKTGKSDEGMHMIGGAANHHGRALI